MPGVVVTTAVRTGPSTTTVAPSSTFFVCGTAKRGSTTAAKLVTSIADFETLYGTYGASYSLHQQLQTYFEEGGSRAYVSRVVGSSSAIASVTLKQSGASATALTINAANAGTWANGASGVGLEIQTTAANTLKVLLDGVVVYTSPAKALAGDLVNEINSSPIATIYINATVGVSNATLGASTGLYLSGGNDGSEPTAAQMVAGLSLFEKPLGSGAVAIPALPSGWWASTGDQTIWAGLNTHAFSNNRIAICSLDSALTAASAVSKVSAFQTANTNEEYAGFYFPSVTMTGSAGTSLTITPEGYVAAKRAIAHNTVGQWQAGAGLISKSNFVTGLSSSIDSATGETLDAGYINALRIIQGAVRIYGARSASSDTTNYRYITYRDSLNYIVTEAESRLEDLVFSTIDGRGTVFGRVEARLIGLLEPIRAAGGLYEAFDADGNQIDAGYSVEVTDALNPVSQLATGLVKAKVGVRLSAVADRIEVQVIKSNLTTSVV